MSQNRIRTSRLVLASSSPRRKELVASLDLSLPVSVLSPDVDETLEPDWTPVETVKYLSALKAQAAFDWLRENVGEAEREAVIVAADTVVAVDGEILGKPIDDSDAARMLMLLQGRRHEVFTGVAVQHAYTGEVSVAYRIDEGQNEELYRRKSKKVCGNRRAAG